MAFVNKNTLGLPMLSVMVSALAAAMSGCIKDDRSNCPPSPSTRTEEVLVVRVTDILSGADITDSGRVIDASLMVFDAGENFITRIDVPQEMLGQEIELPVSVLTRASSGELHISAWGNIVGNIDIQEATTAGDDIGKQFLSLKQSDTYSGCSICPGEIFFGLKKITLGNGDETRAGENSTKIVHIVPITQKTARLAVTVRGLPHSSQAEDYYFSLCEQNDGFTFEGTPVQTDPLCKIRESGAFNAAHEYVSPQPYNLIPSIHPEESAHCTGGVCLYKTGGGSTRAGSSDAGYVTEDGDINLSGKVTVDVFGGHLALYAGQTTNVLMTFEPTGDITVRVVYTPWNTVHQWSEW